MMLKLVSSNVCYLSKIVDDLFLCPEFLIRGFPANNVLSLIGLFIDTSRGAIKLIRSSLRPHFLSKPEMHGSLHPQIELFYCFEKFSLVFFITFYAKEKNLPATFESKKNSIKIARLGCYGKHVRILRKFFLLFVSLTGWQV